jgi:U3 small nucleolar RNA-associated protein 23
MRQIAGVPIIYLSKSIVLMESMADATEQHREREEKSKFKLGLKGQRKPEATPKRKREDEGQAGEGGQSIGDQATGDTRPKAKKRKGPKGPNPLSVKKSTKDKTAQSGATKKARPSASETDGDKQRGEREESAPRKRRRKHKSKADGGGDAPDGGEPAEPASP